MTVAFDVDVANPGQVFACLGFLEAADTLCGPSVGGFRWENPHSPTVQFSLRSRDAENPVADVLAFIARATVTALDPRPGADGTATHAKKVNGQAPAPDVFPAPKPNETSLPICLRDDNGTVVQLGHWADGSSRDPFKLYAGNRSALSIAETMSAGKTSKSGKVLLNGVRQLLQARGPELAKDPFGFTTPMGGSFNFDARCAWQSIDAGFSPNKHGQLVLGSPVVEIMAAWGLENTRPLAVRRRSFRYAVWRDDLPVTLARPALAGGLANFDRREFGFELSMSGKNKVVGYAQEENPS